VSSSPVPEGWHFVRAACFDDQFLALSRQKGRQGGGAPPASPRDTVSAHRQIRDRLSDDLGLFLAPSSEQRTGSSTLSRGGRARRAWRGRDTWRPDIEVGEHAQLEDRATVTGHGARCFIWSEMGSIWSARRGTAREPQMLDSRLDSPTVTNRSTRFSFCGGRLPTAGGRNRYTHSPVVTSELGRGRK